MAASTAGYPSGLPATSSTAPVVQGTAAAGAASLAVYNNQEVDVTFIGQGAFGVNSFLATLLPLGAQLSGGTFEDAGLQERISTNYPEIRFKEIDDIARTYVTGATALIGDTTLTLVSTAGLQEWDVLRNTLTGEHYRINTVASGTSITVARAFGTVAAVAVADAQNLIFLFNATAIGVASRTALSAVAADKTNYFQKFVETVQVSDEDKMSNKVTTKYLEDMQLERMKKHGRDLEYAAVFGQKRTTTDASSRNVTATEGAMQTALRGWTGDISGALNATNIEKEFSRPFAYGSSTKIGLCGRNARASIRALFETRINVENLETVNLKLSYIDMNGGRLFLIDHPFMDTDSGYAGHILIIDPSQFQAVYPSGKNMDGSKVTGKTKFVMNMADSTFALERGDWVTYLGFENKNSNAHGVFRIV